MVLSNLWLSSFIVMKCLMPVCVFEGSYCTQVHYETVALVEAFPVQRHFCSPDHTPALDVEEPFCTEVIGDHMLEPWCHTSCLESQSNNVFFKSHSMSHFLTQFVSPVCKTTNICKDICYWFLNSQTFWEKSNHFLPNINHLTLKSQKAEV